MSLYISIFFNLVFLFVVFYSLSNPRSTLLFDQGKIEAYEEACGEGFMEKTVDTMGFATYKWVKK